MYKKLHLAIVQVTSIRMDVKIIEQSHRLEEFGCSGRNFYLGRLGLHSSVNPEYSLPNFWVRGARGECDEKIIHIPRSEVPMVFKIVLEYNRYFNKNTLETEDVVVNLEEWRHRKIYAGI